MRSILYSLKQYQCSDYNLNNNIGVYNLSWINCLKSKARHLKNIFSFVTRFNSHLVNRDSVRFLKDCRFYFSYHLRTFWKVIVLYYLPFNFKYVPRMKCLFIIEIVKLKLYSS